MTKSKSKVVLALAISFLIASCTSSVTSGSTSTSNNSTNTQDSGNSQSSSSITPSTKINKELIAKKLNSIVEANNFTLETEIIEDSIKKTDIYNEKYVHLETKEKSHILMQNINDSSKINSYSFDNSNNKLSFLSIDSEFVNGEYKNKNNLSSFNPLNEYKNEKNKGTFTKDDILLSVDDYVTNDFGIVISFASMLNLKELAENETFVYAKFNLDEKENLVFTLVELVGLDTFVDYARGTFKNINNSTSKLEEDLLKNSFNYETISSTILDNAKKESYAFELKFDQTNEYGGGWTEDKGVYDVHKDKLHTIIGYDEHYYTKKNNNSYEVYLDSLNNVQEKDTSIAWNDINYLNDIVSSNNLMRLDGNNFRYIGSDTFKLFNALTSAKSMGNLDIEYIDFEIDSTGFKSAHAKFEDSYEIAGRQIVWYEAFVKITEGNNITLPTPLEETSDTNDIRKTFSYFKDTFSVKMYDDRDKSNVTNVTFSNVEGNKYILREEKTLKPGSLEEYNIKRTGFGVNKNNEVVEFMINSENDVFALSKPRNDISITDVLNMNISENLFKKSTMDGVPCYSLRTSLLKVDDNLLGYNHLKDFRPMSLKIYFTDNKAIKPTSYNYRYSYNDGQSTGSETVEFTGIGADEVEIDETLASKIAELTTYQEPSTWEMEENVYGTLISFLGEEKARLVPYIYEKELFGKWYAITTNIVNGKPTRLSIYLPDTYIDFDDETNYMQRLEDKIKQNSHFVKDIDSKGKTIYYYEDGDAYTLAIALSDNPKSGFEVYIPD